MDPKTHPLLNDILRYIELLRQCLNGDAIAIFKSVLIEVTDQNGVNWKTFELKFAIVKR